MRCGTETNESLETSVSNDSCPGLRGASSASEYDFVHSDISRLGHTTFVGIIILLEWQPAHRRVP